MFLFKAYKKETSSLLLPIILTWPQDSIYVYDQAGDKSISCGLGQNWDLDSVVLVTLCDLTCLNP